VDEDSGAVDDGLELGGCEVVEIFCDGGFYFGTSRFSTVEDLLSPAF